MMKMMTMIYNDGADDHEYDDGDGDFDDYDNDGDDANGCISSHYEYDVNKKIKAVTYFHFTSLKTLHHFFLNKHFRTNC